MFDLISILFLTAADAPRTQNLGRNVVLDLLSPLTCEGRNMTVDNFFTSLPLARELLKRRVSLVGTVRANRVDVPRAFVAAQGRELYSSIFGFNTVDQTAMVSYKAKRNKIVVLMSTMHTTKTVSVAAKKKPEIVEFYNKTKGGVDVVDQMIETYSTKFATRRWPVVIFCNIIDMCAINAYALNQKLFPQDRPTTRRVFLKMLGKGLCKQYATSRLPLNHLLNNARHLSETANQPPVAKRARCHVCPRQMDKKSSSTCSICSKNACADHLKLFCMSCLDDKQS